jgi:hypothetical protein
LLKTEFSKSTPFVNPFVDPFVATFSHVIIPVTLWCFEKGSVLWLWFAQSVLFYNYKKDEANYKIKSRL